MLWKPCLALLLASCAREAPTVQLLCMTSRFPLMATTSTEVDDHDHGSGNIALPLAMGRGRCPARGYISLRLTSVKAREVSVSAFGRTVVERVPAGKDVVLTTTITLTGHALGKHPIELRVDGRVVQVPSVEIMP